MKRAVAVAVVAILAAIAVARCSPGRVAVRMLDKPYEAQAGPFDPAYDGADADRPRIPVELVPVVDGLSQPTDIQFLPGSSTRMVVLQKGGRARWFDLSSGDGGTLFELDVATVSEMGLLGLAFHPDHDDNGLLYVHYNPDDRTSRISEWHVDDLVEGATERRVLLEVAQPYQNHDGGQIAFGPDGMLYVGLGDGGLRADPLETGQDPSDLLGAILRIDVSGDPYGIPDDNPSFGPDARPELFAIGLRNPWRFSFDPQGRLVVADVGQDAWEEVDLVPPGANLGWDEREGRHCFEPKTGCEPATDPVYEYGRDEGQSITGGYVYTGEAIPALSGRYVFGDFVSGRIWSIALPDAPGTPVEASTLGRWPILVSTFGRDARGDVYVADFQGGAVYRLSSPESVDSLD